MLNDVTADDGYEIPRFTDHRNPVYIDPYDEGREFAKEYPEQCTSGLLANPAEIMGPIMGYSERDWRQFRKGALAALMKAAT